MSQVLRPLGLDQYASIFVQEGFESWQQLLDITESDLDQCGVKLGHRRRLQRAIQDSLQQSQITPLQHAEKADAQSRRTSGDGNWPPPPGAGQASDGTSNTQQVPQKRKYRRHPKPDENAPERPHPAYVLFSNRIRERLKDHGLSFTEIAKKVGENWQNPDPDERALCEREAADRKEVYYAQLAEYKKTPEYAEYQEYLNDFRARQGELGASATKRAKAGASTPSQVADDVAEDQSISTDGFNQATDSSTTYPSTLSPDEAPFGVRRLGDISPAIAFRPLDAHNGHRYIDGPRSAANAALSRMQGQMSGEPSAYAPLLPSMRSALEERAVSVESPSTMRERLQREGRASGIFWDPAGQLPSIGIASNRLTSRPDTLPNSPVTLPPFLPPANRADSSNPFARILHGPAPTDRRVLTPMEMSADTEQSSTGTARQGQGRDQGRGPGPLSSAMDIERYTDGGMPRPPRRDGHATPDSRTERSTDDRRDGTRGRASDKRGR